MQGMYEYVKVRLPITFYFDAFCVSSLYTIARLVGVIFPLEMCVCVCVCVCVMFVVKVAALVYVLVSALANHCSNNAPLSSHVSCVTPSGDL